MFCWFLTTALCGHFFPLASNQFRSHANHQAWSEQDSTLEGAFFVNFWMLWVACVKLKPLTCPWVGLLRGVAFKRLPFSTIQGARKEGRNPCRQSWKKPQWGEGSFLLGVMVVISFASIDANTSEVNQKPRFGKVPTQFTFLDIGKKGFTEDTDGLARLFCPK